MARSLHLGAWVAGVLVGTLACGPASRALPTAPTAAATVSAHVSPVPPTLRRTSGEDSTAVTYVLEGRVTFRALGGARTRIVSLELVLSDEGGHLSRQMAAVDVAVQPDVDASVALPDRVLVATTRVPTRLTVAAVGVDANDRPFAVPTIDVPVALATVESTRSSAAAVTFVGAGDIGECALPGAALTARAVQSISGSVFTLGDHVYPSGTSEAFSTCYQSTWGAVRDRTYPTPGNHEWDVQHGAPYLAYFGAVAARGYYSFELGGWHVLSLNSNVATRPGSPQYEWVRADLTAHRTSCTLAYWHHPLFSSGANGPHPHMHALWQLLDEAGVDLVMSGHDHLYERFAPQDADGRATSTGMRAFIVGTGGAGLYDIPSPRPNSEVRHNQGWGVLKLTLRSNGYDWEYVPVGSSTFRDFGSGACGG